MEPRLARRIGVECAVATEILAVFVPSEYCEQGAVKSETRFSYFHTIKFGDRQISLTVDGSGR